MSKDPSAPAGRRALQYVKGTHPGGGLPAADVPADQAAAWYTAGQVQEAVESGSHRYADAADQPKKARKASDPGDALQGEPDADAPAETRE